MSKYQHLRTCVKMPPVAVQYNESGVTDELPYTEVTISIKDPVDYNIQLLIDGGFTKQEAHELVQTIYR